MIDWKIFWKSVIETAGDSLCLVLLLVFGVGPMLLGLFVSPWFLLIYAVVLFCIQVKENYERNKYESEDEDED